ncbi:MAG: cytochrome c [Ignavibacteriales bacterium]|nr:cytochrome c [Ignavibacteriales bacterium]
MQDDKKFETEINFKELVKSPSRLFGWIFPYYAVLFLIVGIYFIKHMDVASFNSVPAIQTDSLTINVNVEPKKGGVLPAVDLKLISSPTNELIEKGKTLFKTNCASCHGDNGNGDGAAAAALNPKPRNFHQADGWTNGRNFSNIFSTLQKGVPNTGMIAYEFIPVEDRIAIIQFIRTFTDFPAVSDEEIASMDQTYGLSKGVISPSNIPIDVAEKKIEEENQQFISKVDSILAKVNLNSDAEVLNIFNNYVLDKKRVAEVFSRDFVQNKDAEIFISKIIVAPVANGFKPNIVELSKGELIKLYNVLSKSVS